MNKKTFLEKRLGQKKNLFRKKVIQPFKKRLSQKGASAYRI